jgi:hypothetical protein
MEKDKQIPLRQQSKNQSLSATFLKQIQKGNPGSRRASRKKNFASFHPSGGSKMRYEED